MRKARIAQGPLRIVPRSEHPLVTLPETDMWEITPANSASGDGTARQLDV